MVRWRMRPPKTIVSGTIGPCLSMFNFYRCGMKGTSCRFSAPIWKNICVAKIRTHFPETLGASKFQKMVWNQQTFCPRLSRMFETSIHHFRVCNTPQTVGSQNSNCLWGYQAPSIKGVPMKKNLNNKRWIDTLKRNHVRHPFLKVRDANHSFHQIWVSALEATSDTADARPPPALSVSGSVVVSAASEKHATHGSMRLF